MKTLATWNPINDIERMNAFIDQFFSGKPVAVPSLQTDRNLVLPVDIYEKDGKLVVRAAVPGVAPDELDVQVENNVLTIKGESKRHEEMQEAKVYRSEYTYGTFTRSVRLPENLDLEHVDAHFENGFVTITIPRLEVEKTKAIKVPVRSPKNK